MIPIGRNFVLLSKTDEERRIRIMDDLERRVKRLELLMLKEAENKIASLKDKRAGSVDSPLGVEWTDMVLPIEEIINKRTDAAHTISIH